MAERNRHQQRNARMEEEAKSLPPVWRIIMYTSVLWSSIGGWMYVSGFFTHKVMECRVELTGLDQVMSISLMISGLLACFMVPAGFWAISRIK